MPRPAALAVAFLAGVLLAGCGAITFGQTRVAQSSAGDSVQTVADAADSLDAHRASASENAKAAIAVTNALGSFVRDATQDERILTASRRAPTGIKMVTSFAGATKTTLLFGPSLDRRALHEGFSLQTSSQLETRGGKRVLSVSDLVMRPALGNVAAYCESSAGYSVNGIPSLDETFGWQSGAFSSGTRLGDERGFATWAASVNGDTVRAPIGELSVIRGGVAGCPMMGPTFSVTGASVRDAFSMPVTLTYHLGALWNLSVAEATFANGETLDATTAMGRRPVVSGVITNGTVEIASFRTDALGDGALTITSTGAQYAITDWVVVSI